MDVIFPRNVKIAYLVVATRNSSCAGEGNTFKCPFQSLSNCFDYMCLSRRSLTEDSEVVAWNR